MATKTRKKKSDTANGTVTPMPPVPIHPPMPVSTGPAGELQLLQRQRAVILKSRNMQSNRLQAVVAGTLGYSSSMAEKDRTKKFLEASDLIKKIVAGEAQHPMMGVIRTTMIGITAFNDMKDDLEKLMIGQVKLLPPEIVEWVKRPDQRGFGALFLAIVIGETGDLKNYENPAKLWRRLGCAPWTYEGKTAMGATWRSGREGKLDAAQWEQFGYSPRRRSIAYLIGEGLVKQNGKDSEETAAKKIEAGTNPRTENGPYRDRYEEAKASAKERHPDWSDLRCHRHGMLLATKLLLKRLWLVWNGYPNVGKHELDRT